MATRSGHWALQQGAGAGLIVAPGLGLLPRRRCLQLLSVSATTASAGLDLWAVWLCGLPSSPRLHPPIPSLRLFVSASIPTILGASDTTLAATRRRCPDPTLGSRSGLVRP